MGDWKWVLVDPEGQEVRATETFDSQQTAEQWLTENWSSLADEGAESVSLRQNEEETYRMSLAPG